MDDDEIKMLLGCLLVVLVVVVGPFMVIWALNTLGFAVALTFKTYIAASFLIAVFR
jgi:hypothetical protein